MIFGPLTLFRIGLLGVALVVSVAATLYACYSWRKRQKALKKGRRSPAFVGLVLMFGAVLLFVHVAVVMPIIARWLPVCVLFDSYLCAPYRSGDFGILDDAVEGVWPPANRPDPFCRLVPSRLSSQCRTQGTTGIGEMPACAGPKEPQRRRILRKPNKYNILLHRQPPQLQPIRLQRPKIAGTKLIGDCFYPFKVVDTDMTAACPLFTDELVGHYMALVISAIFGLLSAVAAGAIATLFLAIGHKRKKSQISKMKSMKTRVLRKKKSSKKGRSRTKKKMKSKMKNKMQNKKKNKEKTTSETPPEPPPPPPPPVIVEQTRHVQVEVPVPVPVPVKRRRRRRLPQLPPPPIFLLAPPPAQSPSTTQLLPALIAAPQPPPIPQPVLLKAPQPPSVIMAPRKRRRTRTATIVKPVSVPAAVPVSVAHPVSSLTQHSVVTRGRAARSSFGNLGGHFGAIVGNPAFGSAPVITGARSPSVCFQPKSGPVFMVRRSPSV
ncbi:hypothetical protein HPB48_010100 [Haemaphysalis longicornis]|uniref:Uncharacterized protein n=1 Tax=Haemaphysalis longicornis TaxID=44386 RepID=A0A9J6FYQ1_HAELO|nr:hypothetical protein HPB48_010100 [Haemaphysalis longicornis]